MPRRTTATAVWEGVNSMAHWIAGAIRHKGALTRKAKKAHMGTQAYAHAHAHDSGTTGRQARLALTLAKMHHGRRRGG